MATAKQTIRRMAAGAERVQPALRTLAALRRAVTDGDSVADCLLLLDELTSDLLRVEDAVGCSTPAILFD
jgi:hypothetical protein